MRWQDGFKVWGQAVNVLTSAFAGWFQSLSNPPSAAFTTDCVGKNRLLGFETRKTCLRKRTVLADIGGIQDVTDEVRV